MTGRPGHLVRHTVDPCPHCGEPHDYAVELQPAPSVFGGGSDEVRISVSCPTTGRPIDTTIRVPSDEEFVRVVVSGHGADSELPAEGDAPLPITRAEPAEAQGAEGGPDPSADEYAEWVKASRDQGIDFGKTMLTASSGGVAVYFAVLNYLGTSKAAKSVGGALSALPPLLFLAATAVFASALRPRLAAVPLRGFASFRDARLRQLHLLSQIGTGLFVLALAVALGVYVHVMGLI